jgi:hypothetical protein
MNSYSKNIEKVTRSINTEERSKNDCLSLPAVNPFSKNEKDGKTNKVNTKVVTQMASNPLAKSIKNNSTSPTTNTAVIQLNSNSVFKWARKIFTGNKVEQGDDIYIPNAHIYPHVHVNKDFVAMSQSHHNHGYLFNGSAVMQGRLDQYLSEYTDADIQAVLNHIKTTY